MYRAWYGCKIPGLIMCLLYDGEAVFLFAGTCFLPQECFMPNTTKKTMFDTNSLLSNGTGEEGWRQKKMEASARGTGSFHENLWEEPVSCVSQ